MSKVKKVKTRYIATIATGYITCNRWVSLILLRFARPQCSGFELTGGLGGFNPPSSPDHSIVTPQPPQLLGSYCVADPPQFIFHNSSPGSAQLLLILSSPEVGNGLSWPKPQCTCNARVTSKVCYVFEKYKKTEQG